MSATKLFEHLNSFMPTDENPTLIKGLTEVIRKMKELSENGLTWVDMETYSHCVLGHYFGNVIWVTYEEFILEKFFGLKIHNPGGKAYFGGDSSLYNAIQWRVIRLFTIKCFSNSEYSCNRILLKEWITQAEETLKYIRGDGV